MFDIVLVLLLAIVSLYVTWLHHRVSVVMEDCENQQQQIDVKVNETQMTWVKSDIKTLTHRVSDLEELKIEQWLKLMKADFDTIVELRTKIRDHEKSIPVLFDLVKRIKKSNKEFGRYVNQRLGVSDNESKEISNLLDHVQDGITEIIDAMNGNTENMVNDMDEMKKRLEALYEALGYSYSEVTTDDWTEALATKKTVEKKRRPRF